MSEYIIKRIIEEVVKKKLKSNIIDKNNDLINLEFQKKKFNIENNGLVIKNKYDIKNCFRYIENNKVIGSSVELLYRIFMSEHNYEKCSGYELTIDPLSSIEIICIKDKYEKLLENNKNIANFIEKYEGTYVEIIEDKIHEDIDEIEVVMSFDFNIHKIEDEYHKMILPAIAAILSEIFSLCENDIIPLQISLSVYSDKNLRLEENEISSMHRVFAVFKKSETEENTKHYTGFYYDPEGKLTSYYASSINKILERLKSKKLSFQYINETCPVGIQGLLKDVDIGLCTIYSHFWFHCFIEIIYVIKLYDKKNKTQLYKSDISKYFGFINKCIVELPYKIHLSKYKNDKDEIKYNVNFLDKSSDKFGLSSLKPNLDNEFIINIFFNYSMYIIGLTFIKLKKDDRIKLLNYIKLHDAKLVK